MCHCMAASKTLTPEQRKLRARMAAHSRWAHNDPVSGTAKARAKFNKRFLDEVDPDRLLPEDERLRRAEHAKSAYFTGLALKSSVARKKAS